MRGFFPHLVGGFEQNMESLLFVAKRPRHKMDTAGVGNFINTIIKQTNKQESEQRQNDRPGDDCTLFVLLILIVLLIH